MTLDDRFGRSLGAWLDEEAHGRVPDHLSEVLVRTAATRQRPWWSSLERLLPMTSTTFGGRITATNPLLVIATVGLLLAALAGVALVAAQPSPAIPPAPAANGRIVVADGTQIVSFAADGTDRQVIAQANAGADSLSVSPDGTRVAFTVKTMPPSLQVVSLADGSTTDIDVDAADVLAAEPVGWSPDSKVVAFAGGHEGVHDRLFVAAADGSSVTTPVDGQLKPEESIWQPAFSPDGQWIAFAAPNRLTEFGTLYVMRPDGTGLRALDTPSVDFGDGGGPVWSPAAGTHRIAYLTFHNGGLVTRMFDLDTGVDHEIGAGFWPSWSPDGTRLATCCTSVIDVESAIAGHLNATQVFAPFSGNCGDDPARWTGRSVCSAATWSPDGMWLVGADIAGKDLLLAKADGTDQPRRITLASVSRLGGFMLPVAWQPVWP